MEYTLHQGDITLRPLAKNDAEMLWPYVSNPEISRDMSWNAHKDISETQAFIDNAVKRYEEGGAIIWCVFYQGSFCGVFSLISIQRKHRALTYDKAELAYWIGPEYQGKGIMTEAGKLVIDFAFNKLHLNKLTVAHHSNNSKSKNLILRLGFQYLYEEEESFKKEDEWITCRFYELKHKDFLKKQSL